MISRNRVYLIESLKVPLIAAGKATMTIRFMASTLSTPQGHLSISVKMMATIAMEIR